MCTSTAFHARRQGGVTLIELVIFIVIISVGVVGLLSVSGFYDLAQCRSDDS